MASDDEVPATEPGNGPADQRRWGAGLLARAGHLEYDRILFFSDAVFAIAITLLVVDLRVPVAPGVTVHADSVLRQAIPSIEGFGISFAVIGLFWIGHHSVCRYITAFDRPLIFLNLLFLGTIAFLPYPTQLLSSTHRNQTAAVIFYAACCAAAGLAEAAFWLRASWAGADLMKPGTPRLPILLQILRVPVVFLLSIPVAVLSPGLAPLTWILIWVTGVILDRVIPAGDAREAAGEGS